MGYGKAKVIPAADSKRGDGRCPQHHTCSMLCATPLQSVLTAENSETQTCAACFKFFLTLIFNVCFFLYFIKSITRAVVLC